VPGWFGWAVLVLESHPILAFHRRKRRKKREKRDATLGCEIWVQE
jgi:hypothetical protein